MLRRVGEVTGMVDGQVCVRWASGQESKLPPQVGFYSFSGLLSATRLLPAARAAADNLTVGV